MTRVWGFGPGGRLGATLLNCVDMCRLKFRDLISLFENSFSPSPGYNHRSRNIRAALSCNVLLSKDAAKCGNAQLEAEEIPTGEGTPAAMFSARFNGGPIEQKMRRVHKILVDNSYNALMVEVDAGESFGVLTARYLGRLKADKGLMIAVCTRHYGEMTDSSYCSYYELQFAVTHRITVLPLRVEDTYPPQPPGGKGHLDEHCDAQGYIDMKIGPDVLYVDCRTMSEMDIARAIATRLRKLRDDRQVMWVWRPGMWGFEVQFILKDTIESREVQNHKVGTT